MYATHQPLEVDRSRTRIFGYRLHRRSDADGILADDHDHQCGAILGIHHSVIRQGAEQPAEVADLGQKDLEMIALAFQLARYQS